MKKFYRSFSLPFLTATLMLVSFSPDDREGGQGWRDLLKDDFKAWDVFIGVPHKSLGMKGYEQSDGVNGNPLGLNNDSKAVFSMVRLDDGLALKISGEVYGGLSTKEEFHNYHLQAQFRWGEKKYEPRMDDPRDTGILYHAGGPHGAMWNVWMRAQEMQIQENDCGDYFRIVSTAMDIPALINESNRWNYRKGAELKQFGGANNPYNCKNPENHEKPNGEWNTLDLICWGDTSMHIVNGHVMMVLFNSREIIDGDYKALRKGKIQLQSEGAEVYFRNIRIKSISAIPRIFRKAI